MTNIERAREAIFEAIEHTVDDTSPNTCEDVAKAVLTALIDSNVIPLGRSHEPNYVLARNLTGAHLGKEIAVASEIVSIYQEQEKVVLRIKSQYESGKEILEYNVDPEDELDFC